MPTEQIDAHHHLWDLDVRDQAWTRAFPTIDRTFTMAELQPQLAAAGVTGTVLVETINVAAETPELLELADRTPAVRGVVGWVDLTDAAVADRIAELRALPGGERLVGVRHQVQNEDDAEWLLREQVLRGLAIVAQSGLAFDLLVRPVQLPAAIEAVRRVPAGRFILDHLGKPDIATGRIEPWGSQIRELAAQDNVACKLSGLVTEATASWTVDSLEPFAAHVLDAFGADRVLSGSDWPVCLIRTDYATVWQTHRLLVGALSPSEQAAVLGGTATTWYGLR